MGPSDRHRYKSSKKVSERSRKKKKSKKADYDSKIELLEILYYDLFNHFTSFIYLLGSSSDDIASNKELHPISYYIDDRKELLRQVFKVIR